MDKWGKDSDVIEKRALTLPDRSTPQWSFSAEPHPQAEKSTQASHGERWRPGLETAWPPLLGFMFPFSPNLLLIKQQVPVCGLPVCAHAELLSRAGPWSRSNSGTRELTGRVRSQPCPRPTDSDWEVGPSTLGLTSPPGDSADAGSTATGLVLSPGAY